MPSNINPHLQTVKTELDRLELVERVPVLQHSTVRVLPNHPAVIAYVNECAAVKRPDASLRIARNRFNAARINYKQRCAFRSQRNIEWADSSGAAFVSLSAIIEARAEAIHWRKVIMRLEAGKKIAEQQEQNRQSILRHRLRSMGLAT